MKKTALFIFYTFLFMVVPMLISAQEAAESGNSPDIKNQRIKISIVHIKVPDSLDLNENKNFMDSPLKKEEVNYVQMKYVSDNIGDYEIEDKNAVVIISRITRNETTEREKESSCIMDFCYDIYKNGEKTDVVNFSTVGVGTTVEEAQNCCFRNGTIHVASLFEKICGKSNRFSVVGTYGDEYILNCGKNFNIHTGDEFTVVSGRSYNKSGKMYVSKVEDDLCFARKIYLREMAIPGDVVEKDELFGMGTTVYYNIVFDSQIIHSFGIYEEYFRGLRSFRPVIGVEYMTGDSDNINLYAGLKTMFHLWYVDLNCIAEFGRSFSDGSSHHWGGSVKLTADYPFTKNFRVSLETGYTKWISDDEDDYDSFGGFLLGLGFTCRY